MHQRRLITSSLAFIGSLTICKKNRECKGYSHIISSSITKNNDKRLITREIDVIQNIIRWCGEVGIPSVRYNLYIIGIPRSEREEGRGGSSNDTFRWVKMDPYAPLTIAGTVIILSPASVCAPLCHFAHELCPCSACLDTASDYTLVAPRRR